jgi:phosphate transport system substrate-binding protein
MTAAIERCGGNDAINIPMVGGAIAVTYNLEGIDGLVLSPEAIAGIFASEITKWNDPAIAATNEGVSLPDATIAQFHRSDSSGTTANFSAYLATTAPNVWTYDTGKEWTAPGGQGAKGSDQVIASVEQTANSIGYVELSYVLDAINTKAAAVDQGAGPVDATTENASNALGAAEIIGEGDDLVLSIDYGTTAEGAYPITLVTYELACTGGLADDQNPELVKSFLAYAASDEGQSMLTDIGYVPVSGDLLDKVRAAVDSLQ